MALNSEKLILDRDKLIESIWEYRWWILDNSQGMMITVIQEKQYKRPTGKHLEVQATDILKAKNKGYSEWRRLRRGYKDIFKWYCIDTNQQMGLSDEDVLPLDSFKYSFNNDQPLRDYKFLLSLDYDDLVGLSFALITYLSRYQPLKKKKDKFFETFNVEDRIQYHFMKELKDISIGSIRKKLKDWADDDTDELDEEMAFDTFRRIHISREAEYMKKHEGHAFALGLWAETDEDEKKYYAIAREWKEGIQQKRLEACEPEAKHYWEHGTSKEHLNAQRFLYFTNDMLFSDKQIAEDRKRIQRLIKARRKNQDY